MQKDMDLNLTDGSSNSTPLSLFELCTQIRKTLKETFPTTYWVRAETSDVRINASSGHCYLEFIEKSEKSNQLLAKVRGAIWANVFRMLKPYFETETGQPFASGLKVLVQVTVEYHEVYGISLNVIDIDPTYTLGDLVRKRQEIIKRLQDEGIFNLNKELDFPTLPQRIAVISSPTAAGLGDFYDQLLHNKNGYSFYIKLFPSLMQGEKTEGSIIEALERIYETCDLFDAVVIIRGGGATSELNSFDSYQLAAHCAQFPLPIITGIGHERDETIVDMVAHTRLKTPTAVAAFLITCMEHADKEITTLQQSIANMANELLLRQRMFLQLCCNRFPSLVTLQIEHFRSELNSLESKIPVLTKSLTEKQGMELLKLKQQLTTACEQLLHSKRQSLEMSEQYIKMASPDYLLKKGYSLTLKNGQIIKSVASLSPNDIVSIRMADGSVESEVKSISAYTDNVIQD